MFDNLTDRLSRTLRNISGRGRLTEENIKETLREVRMALLEADVALPVVRDFINRVKEKAVGHEVNKSLTPGQEFVKIVRNELVSAMGEENQVLNLAAHIHRSSQRMYRNQSKRKQCASLKAVVLLSIEEGNLYI